MVRSSCRGNFFSVVLIIYRHNVVIRLSRVIEAVLIIYELNVSLIARVSCNYSVYPGSGTQATTIRISITSYHGFIICIVVCVD